MSEMQFKGYDWTELYEPITGKQYPEDVGMNEEDGLADEIREKISSIMWDESGEKERVVKILRAFLTALSKCEDFESPMWAGMAMIKDDEILLRYVDPLLQYMWN